MANTGNIGKKAMRWVLSFILCIIMFSLSCVFIISITVLQHDFIFNTAKESDYFNKASIAVEDAIIDYGISDGITENVFTGLITSQDIEHNFNIALNGWFDDKMIAIKIKNAVVQYIYSKNGTFDEETKNDVESFVDDCVSEYNRLTQSDLINRYGALIKKLSLYIYIIMIILIIAVVVLIFILRMLYKYKHHWMESVFISLAGTILMLTPVLKLQFSQSYERLRIYPEHFNFLAMSIIKQVLSIGTIYIYSLVLILFIIGLYYFFSIKKLKSLDS